MDALDRGLGHCPACDNRRAIDPKNVRASRFATACLCVECDQKEAREGYFWEGIARRWSIEPRSEG